MLKKILLKPPYRTNGIKTRLGSQISLPALNEFAQINSL